MYSNGGYLLLDFKNTLLSKNPIKIPGISFNKLLHINKPIVVCNMGSIITDEGTVIPFNIPTFSITRQGQPTILNIFSATYHGYYVIIYVQSDDTITANVVKPTSTNTLQLTDSESEVITNAGKSDSNIDK